MAAWRVAVFVCLLASALAQVQPDDWEAPPMKRFRREAQPGILYELVQKKLGMLSDGLRLAKQAADPLTSKFTGPKDSLLLPADSVTSNPAGLQRNLLQAKEADSMPSQRAGLQDILLLPADQLASKFAGMNGIRVQASEADPVTSKPAGGTYSLRPVEEEYPIRVRRDAQPGILYELAQKKIAMLSDGLRLAKEAADPFTSKLAALRESMLPADQATSSGNKWLSVLGVAGARTSAPPTEGRNKMEALTATAASTPPVASSSPASEAVDPATLTGAPTPGKSTIIAEIPTSTLAEVPTPGQSTTAEKVSTPGKSTSLAGTPTSSLAEVPTPGQNATLAGLPISEPKEASPAIPINEASPSTPDNEASPSTPDSEASPSNPENEASPSTPENEASPATPDSEATPSTPDSEASPGVLIPSK